MTITLWLAIGAGALLLGFIVFAFAQGMWVKPEENRKVEDWPRDTLGGPGA
jgi:hypothetical protein